MVVICGFMEVQSTSKICYINILVFRTNKLYKNIYPYCLLLSCCI